MFGSFRQRFAGWIDPERRTLGISPRVDPSFFGGIFGRPSRAGPAVNERSALGITAFWRGVNLYASTIAALSLEVVERDHRGGYSPARSHPLYDLLHAKPNKTTPRLHFWQTLISHALTYKGGFAEIEWSARGRQPLGFHIMDPKSVKPIMNDDRTVKYKIDAQGTTLDSSDVLHIRGLPWDGINGYSLVDIARETLGVTLAQLVHEGAVFGNGARMGGIIELPGRLDSALQSRMRDDINAVHQGPEKSGVLGFLTGGAKWVQTNFSPADTELIASRTFAVAEIARLMGIPPHMLGLMEGATVGNAEQQALQFIKFSLLPWLKAIEGELDIKLFSAQERKRFCTRHDTRTLERGDTAARIAYYKGRFELGSMSSNEVRLAEGDTALVDVAANYHWVATNNLSAVEMLVGDNPPPAEEPEIDESDPEADPTDS